MANTVNSALSSASSVQSASKTANKASLSSEDFLKLFVTQIQNQDFNDPMDNSAMMNQITQLSNMQMMQEMASYSKTSYAMSLIGKNVTASRFVGGQLDTTTGTVTKVSLVDDEYVLYIKGKKYTLEQIMEINDGEGGGTGLDVSSYSVKAASVTKTTATVGWSAPTEDALIANGLTYSVYYSTEGPFNTVTDVQNGTRFGAANQSNLLGATITDLEPGQAYYINVLVQDADGNKYVYSPTLIVTSA